MKLSLPVIHILMMCCLQEATSTNSLFGENDMLEKIFTHKRSTESGIPTMKRGLDRYRFYGFGIGKRRDDTPMATDLSMNDENKLHEKYLTRKFLPAFFYNLNQREHLQKILTQIVSASKSYIDIIKDSENKRDPEVYREEFYPVQAGKQLMESTLDKNLGTGLLEDDLDGYTDQTDTSMENNDTPEYLTDNFESSENSSPSPKDTKNYNIEKRWWAANRLLKLRNQKPSRSNWNSRVRTHVDPALYFLGLGR